MAFISEKRYRLRKKETVVGYMRQIDGRSNFYSKDSFWWNGKPLVYDEVDEWTGLYDKNRTLIYEWDIIYFKIDPAGEDCTGVVLWQTNLNRFVIRKTDDELYFPFEINGLKLFDERQIKVFSYLFLNPGLKDSLGFKDD